MSDVFISYAHSTARQARAAADALRAAGYSVWLDDDLPAHRSFSREIDAQLTAAKAALVIWSADAAMSDWVLSEANRAREERKLVQLKLDDARLPMPFDQIQCADLIGWRGDTEHLGWQKALASIGALVGALGREESGRHDEPAGLAAGNLPRRQGPLIGRRAELEQIETLFEEADLVTITGTGGVGKTRLALEFAHLRQSRHEDGVWLVELAPLTEPNQVVGAVARALGIDLPPAGDPLAALIARLRARDCLIVLDNCEHVIDAIADLAEAVLEQTSRVKLLASSQELISVEGERVFRLRSLGEGEAANLFAQRVAAADADFVLRPRDEPTIAAICQRLDGIPLAIEMAAARAPALGCEGVLQRLDNRFRILTGGRRTALPRQRTLQATLDWSCGLLSAADAAVFRRLGVFNGGLTMEAASKVASDDVLDEVQVIDAVASLVAKSLVVAGSDGERTRYRLLETTRMYALEQLAIAGETAELQRRHAAYFAETTAACRADYWTISDETFHARWAPEMINIEKAIEWAYGPGGDEALGLSTAGNSWAAWVAVSRAPDYVKWAELARSRIGPSASPADVVQLKRTMLSAYANLAPINVPALAAEILDELRAAGDARALGDALYAASVAHWLMGREAEANVFVEELTRVVSGLPISRLTLACHMVQAQRLASHDDPGFRAHVQRGVTLARSIEADGWANLMRVELIADPAYDIERGIDDARDLLSSVRSFSMFNGFAVTGATCLLAGWLARRSGPGDMDEAYRLVRGLEKMIGRFLPGRWMVPITIMAICDGRPADGARLMGYAAERTRSIGVDFVLSRRGFAALTAELEQHLGAAAVESCASEGARLTLDQAYELAMNLG